jgi:hypothetical protein
MGDGVFEWGNFAKEGAVGFRPGPQVVSATNQLFHGPNV